MSPQWLSDLSGRAISGVERRACASCSFFFFFFTVLVKPPGLHYFSLVEKKNVPRRSIPFIYTPRRFAPREIHYVSKNPPAARTLHIKF